MNNLNKEQQKLVEDNHNLIYSFAKSRMVDTEEYYDVFGDEYLDHIDDYEYDQAENYDDHYQERWEHMPPQVVSNRPVTPRGQFRRFEPQQ